MLTLPNPTLSDELKLPASLFEPGVTRLPSLSDSALEMSDANWLRTNRKLFRMSQSNIVTYLEMTTGQNVNPGRVAEIETGQRVILTDWREKLEYLFARMASEPLGQADWRRVILQGAHFGI